MKVSIGVSNHHVHVTEEDFKILFGNDAKLENLKDIHQPGQFASMQKVDVKTDAGELKGLRILGPFRPYTQVEISKTGARGLKINPPVRDSGDLNGASVVLIVGPCGEIEKPCAILANRHIHITEEEKKRFGLSQHSEVSVRIHTEKGGILEHVKLKVSEKSYFEMHIDTDDANAFFIENDSEGEILL